MKMPILFAAVLAGACAAAVARPPNVVIFLVDDLGYGDLACHGNPHVKAPRIDAFAKEAVEFASFHVSPVCAPTRASLLTGRYNFRTGIADVFGPAAVMDAAEVTLAERLKAAGYATGIFGKWHLGDAGGHAPNAQGFDEALVHRGAAMKQYFDPVLLHNDREEKRAGYCMDLFTDAAVDFVRANRAKPFLVYLPANLIHTPLQVAPELAAEFDATGLGDSTRKIHGMIRSVDANFGRVRDVLRDLGLEENTLLILLSDNGPCSGSNPVDRHMAGLHGLKGTVYENGIRVPCFMRWPAGFKAPAKVTRLAAHIDILPTVLEACGVPAGDGPSIDGRSLLPLLRDPAAPWPERSLFLQWDSGQAPRRGHAYTVLTERWKLVQPCGMDAPNQQHIRARYAELCRLQGRGERSIEGPPRFELYDIAADPGETKDLAAATPGVVEAMKRQYDGWFTDVAARWADRKERPGRLRRKDCYFGVHFDFHAEPSDRNIGQNTTREMVHALIDLIQPDFIQVDSKGHPGLSSYPTRVGNHGGSFVGDPLRVWRDVTAERGVALFAHHSGLCDGRAMKDHPAWACVDAQGRTNDAYVALSGPYVDKLLIPQLIELAVDYELDGAWIDAECMGAKIDYSDASRNAFTQQTGIAAIPLKPGDPGWHAWTQFHRETFRKYLRHYTSEVRKKAPGFQLCSNYSFLIPMPEPVSAGVAFLSADVMDLDHMRLYSRFMASQGIPGDLMSWSFTTWGLGTLDPPESRKPAVQLMREAACGIAQGIGYQAVFSQAGAGRPPLRDGSVDLEKLKPMGEVAKFCRERQEVCFKAKPVPQIAVLISAGAQYRKMSRTSDRLFAYEGAHAGIALGLLDNQYAVDVVHGARLVERLQEYPMVVLCEEDYLEPDLRERIGRHVRQGGRLLLVGDGMARLFNSEIGGSARQGALQGPAAAAIACYNVGKGILGVLPGPSVAEYARNADPAVRDMIGAAARALFPEPIAVIAGCRGLDVSVMRTRAGGLAVHLVNTTGPHGQSALLPAIAPVGPVSVTIHCESKPVRVVLEPGGRAIGHTYENGLVRLTLDEVKLHEIIVVD